MRPIIIACVAAAAQVAAAQPYFPSFEPPQVVGSAVGAPLTNGAGGGGQDGWYNPLIGASDYQVFTYIGNTHGLAPNPAGHQQFVAGRSAGAPVGAQHDDDEGWTWLSWDMAVMHDGAAPAGVDLGSLSLEPDPGSSGWRAIITWTGATAEAWRLAFQPYDAAGVQAPPPGLLPGPAWGALQPGVWYRVEVGWSYATNRIAVVRLKNLQTGAATSAMPADWYLAGGAGSALPPPEAFRLVTAGGDGNIVAWDNIQTGHGCYHDCNGDGSSTIADFACFQAAFVAGNGYADCNGSGTLTIQDFACFQVAFVVCS